jgi:hypothetical protein
MRKLLKSIIIILFCSINLFGQKLIMIHPDGYVSEEIKDQHGYINCCLEHTDTIDGMFLKENKFHLVPTPITWENKYDKEFEFHYDHIAFKSEVMPIMFFKNHNFKKDGIQGKLFNDIFLIPDSIITFRIDNTLYKIIASGDIGERNKQYNYFPIKNYTIKIFTESPGYVGITNLLTIKEEIRKYDDFSYMPKLIWIGDLDGDLRLDFILNERDDELNFKYGLYLSSDIKDDVYIRKTLVTYYDPI